jgi:hypothetical protein
MSLLDLDASVSRRQSTWLFELIDQDLMNPREVLVNRLNPPTMRVDTSRPTKRTLEGVQFPPVSVQQVDLIKDRMRVSMLTEDGERHPQGVFMFADQTLTRLTAEMESGDLSLSDQCLIVDQDLGQSYTVRPGDSIVGAIRGLLDPLPITYTVGVSGATVTPEQEAISWDSGANRLTAVNELAQMIGFHELYFDNTGVGRVDAMPNPEAIAPEMVLSHPFSTYLGSLSRSNTLLKLPNRFVVVNSGASQTAVYGVYDLPNSAPHSITNRGGFVIPKVISLQGIDTPEQAVEAARAEARKGQYAYEVQEFLTAPDPRHDHYNVMDIDQVRNLEIAWSMVLAEGEGMRHQVRRTYEEG